MLCVIHVVDSVSLKEAGTIFTFFKKIGMFRAVIETTLILLIICASDARRLINWFVDS